MEVILLMEVKCIFNKEGENVSDIIKKTFLLYMKKEMSEKFYLKNPNNYGTIEMMNGRLSEVQNAH